MQRVFMILTSHRLDCFQLAMDLLRLSGSLDQFDRVVLLLNGVEGRHLRYVNELMLSYPEIPWDRVAGPRGKGPFVASLQNECVRRYPGSLYFKLDEDVFVSPGWVDKLTKAYEVHKDDPALALVTSVIPNNATGFHYLLNAFPDLAKEYAARFAYPVVPDVTGPVWAYPQVAEWITREFLDMKKSNGMLEAQAAGGGEDRYVRFARRFSINCLVYDYRHWTELGGIPDQEEPAWGQWVPDNGKYNVLSTDTLLNHYSFFVQQDWLDRSSLLEDLRLVNIPETLPGKSISGYHAPRWARLIRQAPRALVRKLNS